MVEELAKNMDRVDIIQNSNNANGPNFGQANLVYISILNGPNRLTKAKAQSTWKRSVRSNVKNSMTRGTDTNLGSKKNA